MSPYAILGFVGLYFLVLLLISYFTAKKADNQAFFIGEKRSPWFIVAFGMIGTSLSGVTFISVPGWVGSSQFSYMQVVFGYLIGYVIIATVLMPLYYRLQLTSIYTYLRDRFGNYSYKTGASFFILSRTIGAAFRLFLVANTLQILVFDQITPFGVKIPFFMTVLITILLIWLYTNRGGIKTIVWTDTLQTLFMLLALFVSIYVISQNLNLSIGGVIKEINQSEYSQIFFFDNWQNKNYFFKQFISGVLIAVVMTGLDQDMMQKNLSCKNIGDAQKNMFSFSIVLVFVNLVFLALGALLFIYANKNGIAVPERGDDLFPLLATNYLGPVVGVCFILGLIAAAYSSADSAITALTTSVCIDLIDIEKKPESVQKKTRRNVHIAISALVFIVIIIFRLINNSSVISAVFTAAGYTYGPLLGLYSYGLIWKRKVKDSLVPIICILSPIICFVLSYFSADILWGYKFGFELLLLNGLITFFLLLLSSFINEPNSSTSNTPL